MEQQCSKTKKFAFGQFWLPGGRQKRYACKHIQPGVPRRRISIQKVNFSLFRRPPAPGSVRRLGRLAEPRGPLPGRSEASAPGRLVTVRAEA